MIRLRQTDGRAIPVPATARFIEIMDLEGKVGHVLILRTDGSIQMINAKEDHDQCARYAKTFGVEFCPVIQLPKQHLQPA